MPDALTLLLPEIVLAAAAAMLIVAGTFSTSQRPWSVIALGALAAAALTLFTQHSGPPADCAGLAGDALAQFGRWFALGLGTLLLLAMFRPDSENTSERIGLLLLAIAGTMLAVSAGDLVVLFVGLELISIPTYVLLYLGRRGAASEEAAAKYFFLSAAASAILLYGFVFLYGAARSIELPAVREAIGAARLSPGGAALAKLAVALTFGGLCFKIAAVPFQFYAPDVYQGTTPPNAALLSVLPKAAGLLAAARFFAPDAAGGEPFAWQIVLAVAVLTMTYGNVVALWQDNIRRLMAYSSIGQAGYMLLALAVGLSGGEAMGWEGIAAMLLYLAVYAVATVGAFAALEHLGRSDQSLEGVEELAGLAIARPAAAAVLAVCMFSLAGVPPLAGFWGKFWAFGGALGVQTPGVRGWFVAAAIVGVVNAAVAAAYYLRVVAVMYFRAPLAHPRAQGGKAAWLAALACALMVIGVGLYPAGLMKEIPRSGVRREGAGIGGNAQAINPQSEIEKYQPLIP